ncbi:peptide ABC transporter substrate-binding protein [Pseudoroseicyclus sp. H15]
MTVKNILKGGTAALVLGLGSAAAAQDSSFTMRMLDESPSIDPSLIEDVSGSDIARQLFEGLMNQDAEGNVIPGVATDYEVSEDGLTYTFNLRDGAVWSDGEPVKASDFVYSWQRAANPETASPYAWYIELMSIENASAVIAGEVEPSELGVEAPDDSTFVVHLTTPLPYFPQMVTHTTTFPVPEHVIAELGDSWVEPGNMVSNGAYVLTERVPQERLVAERNDMYWDNENTSIEEVVFLIINDENVALTRYLAGELDRTEVPTGQFPSLSEEYPDQAVSVPSLCTYYYNFNLRDSAPEWEHNADVRKALSLAVDRDVLVDNVLQGGQIPAYTFTPGATAGFEVPDVPFASMTQEERNEMAKELLAGAGYGPDGEPLEVEILYNTSEGHRQIAVAVSQMWQQNLGVTATLANMEWQTFLEERGNGNFDVSRAGWCGDYNEASTFLDLMDSNSGYNDAAYVNADVDGMLDEAKTAEDPQPLYTQIEEIVAEDMPVIPLYHYTSVFMLNPDIQGWPYDNVQGNFYVKDLSLASAE